MPPWPHPHIPTPSHQQTALRLSFCPDAGGDRRPQRQRRQTQPFWLGNGAADVGAASLSPSPSAADTDDVGDPNFTAGLEAAGRGGADPSQQGNFYILWPPNVADRKTLSTLSVATL
jgi:hypothetical protein